MFERWNRLSGYRLMWQEFTCRIHPESEGALRMLPNAMN